MKDIIIIGAGGFAREVAWLIESINDFRPSWRIQGFYDEFSSGEQSVNGYRVLSREEFESFEGIYVVIAIGTSETRKKIYEEFKDKYKFATLVHPNIKVSSTNVIGDGTIICEGTIMTVNINVGKNVIINLDCTIGHDAILKDFTTILPSVNISGNVVVGECTTIGTGSAIIQDKRIGNNSYIGAGSVVVKEISDYVVAVGVPAKAIKSRKEG